MELDSARRGRAPVLYARRPAIYFVIRCDQMRPCRNWSYENASIISYTTTIVIYTHCSNRRKITTVRFTSLTRNNKKKKNDWIIKTYSIVPVGTEKKTPKNRPGRISITLRFQLIVRTLFSYKPSTKYSHAYLRETFAHITRGNE